MNIVKRYLLKRRQKTLMRQYEALEQLQTEHSDDMSIYSHIQRILDDIDERIENIRWILKGRWNYDGQ